MESSAKLADDFRRNQNDGETEFSTNPTIVTDVRIAGNAAISLVLLKMGGAL